MQQARLFLLGILFVLATIACSSTSAEPSAGGAVGESCSTDAQCVDSVCDPVSDRCVACTQDDHCSGAQPVCAENACRACLTDVHCLARAQATAPSEPDLYVFPTSCTTDHRCIAPTRTCTEASACAAFLCPSPYLPACTGGTCACRRE